MATYNIPKRKPNKRRLQIKKGNAGDALRRAQRGKRRKTGPK